MVAASTLEHAAWAARRSAWTMPGGWQTGKCVVDVLVRVTSEGVIDAYTHAAL